MTREKWAAMRSAYLQSGMIEAPIDLDAFTHIPESSLSKKNDALHLRLVQ